MRTLSVQTGWGIVLAGLITGCVTINIYFPAAAAEKAADKIIEEVWQTKKSEAGKEPAKPAESPAQPK